MKRHGPIWEVAVRADDQPEARFDPSNVVREALVAANRRLDDLQQDRPHPFPARGIKHRVRSNWLKMYDKSGWVLRIETVINDPREFRMRRLRTRDGRREMVWYPMSKGAVKRTNHGRSGATAISEPA